MFSRKRWWLALLLPALTLAELPEWIRYLESGTPAERAFFRPMNLPAGPVPVRRPPQETRAELTRLIAATPADATLYALRAREAEMQLDAAAAEADWKKHAELAADKVAAFTALADFYHRRLKVAEELAALGQAAAQPAAAAAVFERMLSLSRVHLLPIDTVRGVYRQWTTRLPADAAVWRRWLQAETNARQFDRLEPLLADYARRFPQDPAFAIEARAGVEKARGNTTAALAIYDHEFRMEEPLAGHFALLRETRQMRAFLNAARAASSARPMALGPVARQFHYWMQEGNAAAAQRVLLDYRRRKESRPGGWTAEELRTVASLWQPHDRNESARHWYALYSLPGAAAAEQESALAALGTLLLSAPDQPLPLAQGDLTFYQDIATADAAPGVLNGILSLVLNSADVPYRFAGQERQAVPYFQRAKASELVELFDRRFPQSSERPWLRMRLLEAYAAHGEDDGVLRGGRQFLTAFPDNPARAAVSLLMADAHARKSEVKEEIAVYDALLVELAKKAQGQPLGAGVIAPQPGESASPRGPRDPQYARALDRYVSRLVALRRPKDALAVLRKEIDRNPNDPGLYERLAAFLDQNKLGGEIEAVYRRAAQQFPDAGWHHKLARYYLQRRQMAAFAALTAEVTKIFRGSELERYFQQIVQPQSLDGALVRQVNLAAHQRFPYVLAFVRNLLDVYQRRGTVNAAAYEELLRRYWFYDEGLRARLFAHLQQSGKLNAELQALAKLAGPGNPGATQMQAEAEAWRAHFELAAPGLLAAATATPGDVAGGVRASMLQRSLGQAGPAAAVEAGLIEASPRDLAARVRLGELNREFSGVPAGRDAWDKIPDLEPGNAGHYLEAATVHWDYFEYDAALAQIRLGRARLGQPALYAYEAGAIHENQRQYPAAIEEYVQGALAEPGGSLAQSRLLRLARRPALRASIDAATARAAGGSTPSAAAISLRMAVLEEQQRGADLEAWLLELAAKTESFEILARLEQEGQRLQLARVEERAIGRQVELIPDPVDKLRKRLELVRFEERRRNPAVAARLVDTLVRENPTTMGIVRAAVNYHWRNRNGARAVELLSNAASAAHPSRKALLQLEAARKATLSGQYAAARGLLQPLLAAEPFHAGYLGAMADTYAREGDDRGLRAHYQESIAALAKAPLPAGERLRRSAELRRALVPVLTRAREHQAAIDQYIEVLNRYPEDAALVEDVIRYARQHQQQTRVLAYYQKAAAAAPRDFRFPLLLARLHSGFEDYAAAIQSFAQAAQIRPDRPDLLIARGNLEERLLRFDEAVATFTKVYDLTYRNSTWMERVAELRARQGRTADALAAISTAFLEGRTDSPQAHFDAAERLARWELNREALALAEKGTSLAGGKLAEDYAGGAVLHARLLARERQYAAAFARLPAFVANTVAEVVRERYTAPEKAQFAAFLDTVKTAVPPEIGRVAGVASWTARRLEELLLAAANQPESNDYLERLRRLQQDRLQRNQFGGQLEAYARLVTDVDARRALLRQAAEAYRDAGNVAAEIRLMAANEPGNPRYLELIAQRNPEALTARAAIDYGAVTAALAAAKPELAMAAIEARGRTLDPVWTRAHSALGGLYLGMKTPNIETAFSEALGAMRIGDVLGKPADRKQQLAGGMWFYYGGRFGEYLDLLGNPDAAGFLPAVLEASPGRAAAYAELAGYHRESNRPDAALADYGHALQLQPASVEALDGAARVLWAMNRREEALNHWRQALAAVGNPQDLRLITGQLAARQQLAALRPELERAVERHLRSYGSFQTGPVLRYFDAAWIVAASRNTSEPAEMLQPLLAVDWIANDAKEPIYLRLLEVTGAKAATAIGDARNEAANTYWNLQGEWLRYLVDRKQADRAQTVLDSLNEEGRERLSAVMEPLRWRIAGLQNRLTQLLAGEVTAPAYALREAAMAMRAAGDDANARRLLRFAYERELAESSPPVPASFLGLAEVLLESGETAAGVAQLRRMALVADPPFVHLKDAARLLQRFGKTAEAQPFLDEAAKAIPWDSEVRRMREPAAAAAPPTRQQLAARIRDNPEDREAKLQLFDASFREGRHLEAAQAMEWLLGTERQAFVWEQPLEVPDGEDRELPPPLSVERARNLSQSLAATNRLYGAILIRRQAQKRQPVPEDAQAIAQWTAELERRRTNQERRPTIGPSLEQERLVRPMIAAAGGAR